MPYRRPTPVTGIHENAVNLDEEGCHLEKDPSEDLTCRIAERVVVSLRG